MTTRTAAPPSIRESSRDRLIASTGAAERHLHISGISTSILEAGEGAPVVLLHEQAEFAARWMRVIPGLARTNRVIAPDLPGHGASQVLDGELDADRVLAWLSELIERTCDRPPVLVGHMLGGAIAARFAIEHGEQISGLVLVDALGLKRFLPSPGFALALVRFVARPSSRSREGLYRHCTTDLDGLREEIGAVWEDFDAYGVEMARDPGTKAALRALMGQLGVPAIPAADLERIAVPTTLIWGRHDPVTRVKVAEAASERYGWPLHIAENAGDDVPLEQPEEFLRALHAVLEAAQERSAR